MTKSFNPELGIVTARVVTIPMGTDYFFAQNGEPKQILCHRNQGGWLEVSRGGHLTVKTNAEIELPQVGDEIALIRLANRPSDPNYTRASVWVENEDWMAMKWATKAQVVYVAKAYNHRQNGDLQDNARTEIELATGTLISIIRDYPRTEEVGDHLGSNYETKIGNMVLSYDTAWYRRELDGTLTEVADPRPVGVCL